MDSKIVSKIEEIPEEVVYDLKIKRNKNFIANGVIVHNCDYRGEISVVYKHDSDKHDFILLDPGTKIVQGVILPIIKPVLEEVEVLSETVRGSGGFGSTGDK